ncbi:MAG TPA: tail fiber domain-containing protein [Aquabacterium sp.]|nr:tail fiber domain-containing protein [Aquabacterium sp.]
MLIPTRFTGHARDGRRLYPFDFGDDAPAPDPLIGQAASKNAEIAEKALSWYQAKDEADRPLREQATRMALEQAAVQTETARKQNAMADETYAYTKSVFRPAEERMATDAMGYDTAERREQEAGQAVADVQSQFDVARGNLGRELAARGVSVGSGAGASAMGRIAAQEGLARAAMANQARKNVETVGAAKVADVAALGRNIAATNATQTQLGLQAGNSSVGNAQVPLQVSAQQGSQMAQGFGVGIQGNTSAGNLMVGQYGAQAQAASQNNGLAGALGSVAGALINKAPIFGASDEKQKEGVTPTTDEEALEAIAATPVKNWKYKADSPAADGGQQHTGPMAQDVQKTMGSKLAPRGKVIDLVSANGITMKAVQAVNKKVDRLAAALGVPA